MVPKEIEVEGRIYKLASQPSVKTHIIALLDRSGSMASLVDSTIEGYNGFIDGLRDENALVTTVIFDDFNEYLCKDMPIAKVRKLTKEKYFVRGGTALIDAFVGTLKEIKSNPKHKYIVLVITDGQENSSRQYDSKQMKSLVERLTGKGNWTFTYIGANQDSWDEASKWGFRAGNVATYTASAGGTHDAWAAMSVGVGATIRSSSMNNKSFYAGAKDEE